MMAKMIEVFEVAIISRENWNGLRAPGDRDQLYRLIATRRSD
jgi:hypothetical protein